jgi:hypothetical protein
LHRDLINSWRDAANDLGIAITTPFTVELQDGSSIEVELLVHSFGRPAGTAILTTDEMGAWERFNDSLYYCSALNPPSYVPYNRTTYIETLQDWGWFGSATKVPDWYA